MVPRKPILISKSSNTITLKLPPFYPILDEYAVNLDPNIAKIN